MNILGLSFANPFICHLLFVTSLIIHKEFIKLNSIQLSTLSAWVLVSIKHTPSSITFIAITPNSAKNNESGVDNFKILPQTFYPKDEKWEKYDNMILKENFMVFQNIESDFPWLLSF